MNWISLIGSILSGGILKSTAETLSSDEAIYNKFGIKNQSLVNWERQQYINDLNNRLQTEWNEKTLQNEWDMWNATNAYNTPQAQMERYKAAGLNPNLIYGQQNTASPVSIPTMAAPKAQSYNSEDPTGYLTSIIGTILKIPQIFQQYKQTQMINDNLEQDNLIKRGMADYWAAKAQNESYNSSEKMFKSLIWSSMHNNMTLSGQTDKIANMWFENLKDSLLTNGLKNKVLQAQELWTTSRRRFEEMRNKYYEGFEGSRGLFDIERDLKEALLGIKQIDWDFQKSLDFSKAANPFLQLGGNLLKMLIKGK